MSLANAHYKLRILDQKISRYLKTFGAISVEGPRWCGKTWTVLNQANSIAYLMDNAVRTLAELDTAAALSGAAPHAIDEWQEIPALWDAVRFAVDKNPKRGQFLLTGSVIRPQSIRHSGIGRIARVRMRTMSLYESGDSSGLISLKALLAGKKPRAGRGNLSIQRLAMLACRGGWPINLSARIADPLALPVDYLNNLVTNDIPGKNIAVRETAKFRHFLAALARNNATPVKNATLHKDVQAVEGEFSANTLAAYLQILRDLYILEEIPGWRPQIRSKARILSIPKKIFTDPSLAAAALGVTPKKLLSDLPAFGGIFEGLCLRDLLVYAEANDARVFYYRDNSALEVDAIIEKSDGDWGAFEIKLGGREIDRAAKNLLRLRDKMARDGARKPRCLAVLTGAELALQRADGVSVVPISMLKD